MYLRDTTTITYTTLCIQTHPAYSTICSERNTNATKVEATTISVRHSSWTRCGRSRNAPNLTETPSRRVCSTFKHRPRVPARSAATMTRLQPTNQVTPTTALLLTVWTAHLDSRRRHVHLPPMSSPSSEGQNDSTPLPHSSQAWQANLLR